MTDLIECKKEAILLIYIYFHIFDFLTWWCLASGLGQKPPFIDRKRWWEKHSLVWSGVKLFTCHYFLRPRSAIPAPATAAIIKSDFLPQPTYFSPYHFRTGFVFSTTKQPRVSTFTSLCCCCCSNKASRTQPMLHSQSMHTRIHTYIYRWNGGKIGLLEL